MSSEAPRKLSRLSLSVAARGLLGGTKRESRAKKKGCEVEYMINASRWYRYDLHAKLDNKVESSPVVNGRAMFLPGWEGTIPIFIPAQHVVCGVLVVRMRTSSARSAVFLKI